jgi:broad specificity phosphatase PhoE
MDTGAGEELESTGVAAADAALARLRDAETAPLDEHVEIFDDVQQRLHEGLAELDDEQ